MVTFDISEYETRLDRTRERMRVSAIDTLLVTDPANMHYLTGYDAWSFYTPQGVVVPPEGDPLLFTRAMDTGGARLTTWLEDMRILGFPEEYVQQRDRHPMQWVASELLSRDLAGPVIALEMDSYYFSPRAYEALRGSLSGSRVVDAEELVDRRLNVLRQPVRPFIAQRSLELDRARQQRDMARLDEAGLPRGNLRHRLHQRRQVPGLRMDRKSQQQEREPKPARNHRS
jgi:hypothetical protein